MLVRSLPLFDPRLCTPQAFPHAFPKDTLPPYFPRCVFSSCGSQSSVSTHHAVKGTRQGWCTDKWFTKTIQVRPTALARGKGSMAITRTRFTPRHQVPHAPLRSHNSNIEIPPATRVSGSRAVVGQPPRRTAVVPHSVDSQNPTRSHAAVSYTHLTLPTILLV